MERSFPPEMLWYPPRSVGGRLCAAPGVPVYDVTASVAAGVTMDRIFAAYQSLDADTVDLATIYAEATRARGRPRRSDKLPKCAVIVADWRVPRRRSTG